MSVRCKPRYVRVLRAFVSTACVLTIGLGVLIAISWLLGVEGMPFLSAPRVLHPLISAGLILLGGALWLQRTEPVDARALRWAHGFALAVVVMMVAVVLELLVEGAPNPDQVLFPRGLDLPLRLHSVAPNSVANFLLVAFSLLLLNARKLALQRLAQALALSACIVAFLPLLGHLFRNAAFTRVMGDYLPMSLYSAISFLLLGTGVLASRPARGFMRVLCSDGLGGRMLRSLLPVLLLAPIALGLLGVWSQRVWGLEPVSGIGLLVTGMVMISASMLWWNSGVLDRVEAALLDSEEKRRNLIDASPDLIMIRDREGKYLLANPAFGRMVGRPVGEILGRRDGEIFDAETARRIQAQDQEVLSSEAPLSYEIAIHTPRGDDRIFDSSKYPYYSSDGELIGVMVISRDVTERHHLEAKLREQYEKLKELDKLKGDFVNAVSHDLRTPLTSILGYAEFLEDGLGGSLTEQQRAFVAQIAKSSERLEGMVNDLLDVARLDAGTFRLHCEEVDLAERVREMVESLRPQATDRRLTLQAAVSGSALRMVLDPQRIDRVLANLIGNAMKFTPEGGRIEVRLREDADGVLCEVEDTGIGIAAEDIPKLFQRFTQLAAGARMKAGTGLGLSISKAQVEAHGGTVGVRSEPGKGSTFWFRLPRGVPEQCRVDFSAAA